MFTPKRLSLGLTTPLLLAGSSVAQELVYTLGVEATSNSDYGRSVGDAGDVDQDGHGDVIVGAPFDSPGGSIHVYSGRTGSLIWSRFAESSGDAFGWSVDGLGDVNGDGASDLIATAPLFDTHGGINQNAGKVYVISGATGNSLIELQGGQTGGQFGSRVRGLGDISGDGVGDFAIGSQFMDGAGLVDRGELHVYSGGGQSLLYSKAGTEAGQMLGASLDVLRATGVPSTSRIIVGSPGWDGPGTNRGLVQVYNGLGNLAVAYPGPTNDSGFGLEVAGVGDVNNDGFCDYAVGAPGIDVLFVGADAGAAYVYNGTSTVLLYRFTGPHAGAFLGQSLDGVGDVNGDGHADLLIGSPNLDAGGVVDAGQVSLISGANGSDLATYVGGINDHMGRSVSSAGDLNGDGIPDFVIGANDAPFGQGAAYVYLGGLDAPQRYCTSKLNSEGCLPAIDYSGTPSASIANDFQIHACDVINNKTGLLFWGRQANSTPFLGGTLCVQAPIRRTPPTNSLGSPVGTDCTGEYTFAFSHSYMSTEAILPGDTVHCQFWTRDPAASFGVGLTDALAFDVTH